MPVVPRSLARAQSNVLGVILLFGIVITVSVAVVVAGSAILETSQTTASMESAVLAMSEIDGHVTSLGTGPETVRRVSIERLAEKGDLEVSNEGTFRVVVNDSSSTVPVLDVKTKLGKIVFERNDHVVAYQGGGIWRASGGGNNSAMVSPPRFEYRYRQGDPTLTLPLVNVTGTAGYDGVTLRQVREKKLFPNNVDVNPLASGEEVTLQVESEFYKAWGTLFQDRTNGTVRYDHGSRKATVVLTGDDILNVSTNVVVPGALFSSDPAVLNVDNTAGTGSYDSRVQPVSFSGTNGDLYVSGGFSPTEDDIAIQGEVVASGSSSLVQTGGNPQRIGDNATFGGNPGETTELQGYHFVNGSLSTQSNLSVWGDTSARNVTIRGDVFVGGSVTRFENVYVDGDVYVSGDFEQYGPNAKVTGNVSVEGDITAVPCIGGGLTCPDVYDVSDVPDPRPVTFPDPEPQNSAIAAKGSELQTDNDNANASSTIADINGDAPGTCTPCTLTSGAYYLNDGLELQSEKLVLDTRGGPIEIYAEDGANRGVYVKNSNVTILGDNPVHVYTPADFEIVETGGAYDTEIVTRPDPYRAPNFKLFVRDDANVQFNNGDPVFTGLLYGPGDPNGADVILTNDATVYGSVVGNLNYFNENAQIFFDESLAATTTNSTVEDRTGSIVRFVHVTTKTVQVGD